MEINEIMKILPHRYPFLLVDRVLTMNEKKIEAIKNVTIDEPFFIGHFPDAPIMPGVLIVEALAQTAGVLLLSQLKLEKRQPLFLGIDNARFRKVVVPGDTLRMGCELKRLKQNVCRVTCQAFVKEDLVCEAELLLGFK